MASLTVLLSSITMSRKTADDTAAFNELVEKMTFYNDIVHINQPFLRENFARAQKIHDELSLSVGNLPLPGTRDDQKENLKNVEAFCSKEPQDLDE